MSDLTFECPHCGGAATIAVNISTEVRVFRRRLSPGRPKGLRPHVSGEELKAERLKRKLTQDQLAAAYGCTRPAISQFESKGVSPEVAQRLRAAMRQR